MGDVMKNLSRVSARLSEETFLTNKGLSNEVGIHVFCYDPKDELTVRAYFETLKSKTDVPYRLIECDLYKIFLQICEEKHILKSIPNIIKPLGHMRMTDVTADDIKLALVPVSQKSASVFKSVNILLKCIFNSAEDSKIITYNPTRFLSQKGGGIPQKDRESLTDEQVALLLKTIRDLPPYVFVMLGLYAGLRREEILALKWECVILDTDAPYIKVRRAWHTESNRPVIMTELKTPAARRDIAIPKGLADCLREAKEKSTSEYVVANKEGGPLTYTEFRSLWRFIVVRTAKPRKAKKKVGGKYVKYMLYPQLGEMARNNGKVQYVLDFEVTPHQLRHTYITNLIAAGVDPKTVQYLAGHEKSKITMDIYAKVKCNKPEELAKALTVAFDQWKKPTDIK